MGFRGEALASISAVSHFTLSTRREGSETGTRIVFKDGHQQVDPWSGPSGTQISIADLFFNVPARKAFLKTGAAEFAQCHEFVQALVLNRPDLSLSLKHNGKIHLDVNSLETQSPELWGEFAIRKRAEMIMPDTNGMIYLCQADKFGSLEALCSPPGMERGSHKFMFTFVNGRWVKDRILRYSILRGYHSHLLKGKFPICAMNLRVEPSLVDVNVHPAKAEVRFQYTHEVQSFLAQTIKDRLRDGDWATAEAESRDPAVKERAQPSVTTNKQTFNQNRLSHSERDVDLFFKQEKKESFYKPAKLKTSVRSFEHSSLPSAPSNKTSEPVETVPARGGANYTSQTFEVDLTENTAAKSTIPWQHMRFLGAFGKCYLLFEWQDKLYALDQHAFHERILYERLLQNDKILQERQPLLMPEVLHLGSETTQKLVEAYDDFSQYGFDYKKVSQDEIEVNCVPSLLKNVDLETLFLELSLELVGEDPRQFLGHHTLATIACHAAVRSGEELPEGELEFLLGEADSVDFYENCPHGRRVIKIWSRDEVGKWFDR